jgi:hypothetical protein
MNRSERKSRNNRGRKSRGRKSRGRKSRNNRRRSAPARRGTRSRTSGGMRFWETAEAEVARKAAARAAARKDMSARDLRKVVLAEGQEWQGKARTALDDFKTTEYEDELTRFQETLRGDQPMTTRTTFRDGKMYGDGGDYAFEIRRWRNMQFMLPQVLQMNMKDLIPKTGGAVQMNVDGMITQIRELVRAPTERGVERSWTYGGSILEGRGGLRGKIQKLYEGFIAAGTAIPDPVPKLRGCIRDLIISIGTWEEWKYTPEGSAAQRSTVIAESATNAQGGWVELLPMNDIVVVEKKGVLTLDGLGSESNFLGIRGADGQHVDPFNTVQHPPEHASNVSHREHMKSGEQLTFSQGTGMAGRHPGGYHGTRGGIVQVGQVGDDDPDFGGYD